MINRKKKWSAHRVQIPAQESGLREAEGGRQKRRPQSTSVRVVLNEEVWTKEIKWTYLLGLLQLAGRMENARKVEVAFGGRLRIPARIDGFLGQFLRFLQRNGAILGISELLQARV